MDSLVHCMASGIPGFQVLIPGSPPPIVKIPIDALISCLHTEWLGLPLPSSNCTSQAWLLYSQGPWGDLGFVSPSCDVQMSDPKLQNYVELVFYMVLSTSGRHQATSQPERNMNKEQDIYYPHCKNNCSDFILGFISHDQQPKGMHSLSTCQQFLPVYVRRCNHGRM